MENHEISADIIVKNRRGVDGKDFKDIVNEYSDPEETDLIHHSPYYSPSQIPSHIKSREVSVSVLSLNAQSIQATFSNFSLYSTDAFTKSTLPSYLHSGNMAEWRIETSISFIRWIPNIQFKCLFKYTWRINYTSVQR